MPQQETTARIFRRALIATLGAVTVLLLTYMIYQVRMIIVMVALGGFLAYFLNWPITWLGRYVRRPTAIRIVFYTFLVLMLGTVGPIGGLLYTQGYELVNNLPDMLERMELYLQDPELRLPLGLNISFQEQLQQWIDLLRQNSGQILERGFSYTQRFLSGTAAVVGALLFIPLIALYFLMDGARLRTALVLCFNEQWREDVDLALEGVSRSLGGYVYGKTVTSLIAAVMTTAGLYVIGVPFALVLGLIVFIGEYIPIVGNMIAFIPIAIVAFANDPIDLIWVTVITLVIQAVQNYIIVPRLMGESMNLHPLTVLIALLAGGTVAGLPGMLLALPIAAAGKILLNIFVWHREEPGIPAMPLLTWKLPLHHDVPDVPEKNGNAEVEGD